MRFLTGRFVLRLQAAPIALIDKTGPRWRRTRCSSLAGGCEGDDEVLHWQKFRGLLGEASLGLVFLAVRAVPIAASTADQVVLTARTAAIHRVTKVAGFTTRDQPQDLAVMRRHASDVLGDVSGSELPQCVGDGEVLGNFGRFGVGDHLHG